MDLDKLADLVSGSVLLNTGRLDGQYDQRFEVNVPFL